MKKRIDKKRQIELVVNAKLDILEQISRMIIELKKMQKSVIKNGYKKPLKFDFLGDFSKSGKCSYLKPKGQFYFNF